MTPILAVISLTHLFIGNAVDRDRWGNYQGNNLSQRAQIKCLKHAWAENERVVVPFVSDTLGSMSGNSAATLCLFAWCQAGREAEFFVENWGRGAGTDNGASALVEASKRAFLTLSGERLRQGPPAPVSASSKIGSPAGTGLPFSRRKFGGPAGTGLPFLRLPALRTSSV